MIGILVKIGVRLLGFGLTSLGAWIAAKHSIEAGAAVSAAGGAVLHEAESLRNMRK
jgi:hypothetical protein